MRQSKNMTARSMNHINNHIFSGTDQMKIDTTDLGLNWISDTIKGRAVRIAEPTPAFWDLWREHKDRIKSEGFGVYKPNGNFVVVDNNERDPEAVAETAAIAQSSQAIDAPKGYEIPVPDGLAYLPYQRGGVKALEERHAALLADPMGLGKTIQICGLLNKIPAELRTILIVVPASLKLNWKNELCKWLVIPRRIDVANGGKERLPDDPDVVIINYDVLAKHSESLLSRTWDCVIFDESHYLKNPKTIRTGMALKIRARRRYALTGTPIPNRPIELQPILGYLAPKEFGNFFSFAKRYANAKKGRWGWDFSGSSNLGELRKRLRSTLMIRREKSEVLTDLPAKRRQVIVLPADQYKEVLRAERSAHRVDEALAEALTMIESGGTVDFSEMSKVRHETALEKVPAVVDHLIAIDEPVVVFAHHHDVMAEIAQSLEDQGRRVVMLHGKHSTEERQKAVDDFQNGRADVFIGGMKAAGVGITLTRASIAVFAEMDFCPSVLDQCEDRLHRIGQHSPVLCQHLVIDQSLDHRVIELVVSKQSVISEVMQKQTKTELVRIAEPITLESLAADLIAQGKFKVREPRPEIDRPTLDIAGPYQSLRNAEASGLKWPTLRFDGMAISLATSGRNTGCLYVKRGPDYGAEYLGKITTPDGTFYPSRDCTEADCERLTAILSDFEGELKAHGINTGVCGCCGRELTNPESIANGIGPICADRFIF